MDDRITIIIEHSKLKREVYNFWLRDAKHAYLDEYNLELRKSPRHKFVATKHYSRLEVGSYRSSTLKEEQVILSDEIKEMVKQKLIEQLKVLKWNDNK